MRNANANLLFKKIEEYENIIIAKHVFPDWDAIGSAEGLRNIIMDNFNNKNVYVVGDNILMTEKIDDLKLNDDLISNSFLITVDTGNIERVDFNFLTKVKESFRIDHHINNSPYTDHEYVFEDAIACSEIITLWANELNLKISKIAAEFLYKGIIADSNGFAYENTSDRTFEAAKILYQKNINIAKITQDLRKRSLKQARWCAESFRRFVFFPELKFGYIKVDYEDMLINDLSINEFKCSLSTMNNIENVDVWLFAYRTDPKSQVKVSLRSKKININKAAVKWNGGGHNLASALRLNNWEEFEIFLSDFKKYVKEMI